jgi:taurine--2-oxoglutarate transaminase
MARLYTGRSKAVSRYRSYHGATMGAVTLGGDWRRAPVEPGIPGVTHVDDFHCPQCPHEVRSPECDHEPLTRIPRTLELEGNVGAVFVESVVGANGVLIPPPGYMQRLRQACDRHAALLVCDEVLAGFGRTGRWFGFEHFGAAPDLITLGKALTGGYGTLGAVVVHDRIARHFEDHTLVAGLTHYAHPLGVAAGLEATRVYQEEGLIEHAARLEPVLRDGLEGIQSRSGGAVRQNRVIGLLSASELSLDAEGVRRLARALRDRHVHVHLYPRDRTLILSPPLCITEQELGEGLARVEASIQEAIR